MCRGGSEERDRNREQEEREREGDKEREGESLGEEKVEDGGEARGKVRKVGRREKQKQRGQEKRKRSKRWGSFYPRPLAGDS